MNTKQLFLALTAVILPSLAMPMTFYEENYTIIDNVRFQVITETYFSGEDVEISRWATVVASNNTEELAIPGSITYEGKEYEVSSISYEAFRYCSNLKSLKIPNTVTEFGLYCVDSDNSVLVEAESAPQYNPFMYCANLEKIEIEEGNKAWDSSKGCNAIIEKTTKTLVAGCKNTVIPNSVTSIKYGAFYGCTGLSSITIPNSVTSIGEEAFSGCTSLTSVTFPNSVTDIESSAFSGCTSLVSVTIPNSVKRIGSNAFNGCTSLANLVIGNSVTSIGNGAFEECGLTSVTFHCKEIGSWSYFSSIKEIIIGDEVTSIGNRAFEGCTGITSVTIGNSVISIGEAAFSFCSGLNSITIPNSVTSIGNSAFIWCSSLTSITIPNRVTNIGNETFEGCTSLISVTIPNSVTSIGEAAFSGCTSLISVTIPNSVTSIGRSAFCDCTSLTSVTIPNSVMSIGETAFYGCSSLSSVTIGEKVTSIGQAAFGNCQEIEDVFCLGPTAPAAPGSFYKTDVFNTILHVKSYAYESFKEVEPWTYFKLIAPEKDYYNLTYYVDNILYKQYKHKYDDVITPEPDPEKEQFTFSGWSDIPENMPDYDVNVYGTFSNTEITVDGITYQIKDNVATPIKNTKSGDITIQPYIEDRGKQYPVKAIPSNVFANNTNITSLVIPDSVETILPRAFSGCRNIATITLPSSVKTIGERAFANIDKLNEVICHAKAVPAADRTTFENSYIDYATLQVPQSSVNTYKATDPWSGFKQIVPIPGTNTQTNGKCATPSIIMYYGSKILLSCTTPDVTFHYDITRTGTIGPDEELPLTATYTLTVHASKEGYEDSDTNKLDIPLNGGEVGDANNDGSIDVADIAAIIDIMAKK